MTWSYQGTPWYQIAWRILWVVPCVITFGIALFFLLIKEGPYEARKVARELF